MQSIKLLKVQAKERDAAEEYERELEKIIKRAELVDKTTKEYTEEQNKTIGIIGEKDAQLKDFAKMHQGIITAFKSVDEAQREEEEQKKINEYAKEIEKVKSEITALAYFSVIAILAGIAKLWTEGSRRLPE